MISRLSSDSGNGQKGFDDQDIVSASIVSFDRVDNPAFSGELTEDDIIWDADMASEATQTGQITSPYLGQSYFHTLSPFGTGAFFPLTERNKTTALQFNGVGFNGTYALIPEVEPGPFPGISCVYFGDGQSLEINAAANWFAGNISISGWVKAPWPTPQNRTIVSQKDGSGTGRSAILVSPINGGEYGTFLGGSYRSLDCSPSGEWEHIVLTSGGGQIKFYLNGELKHTSSVTPEAANGNFVVGAAKGEDVLFFMGCLSHFALSTSILSLAQIEAAYIAGKSPQTINITPEISSIGADGVLVGESDGLARVLVTDGRTGRELRQDILSKDGVEVREFNRYTYGSMTKAITDTVVNGISGNNMNDNGFIFDSQNHSSATFVRNTDCWIPANLLTGISPSNTQQTNKRAGTAITPRHIALAKHFQIAKGQTIRFVTEDNTVISRTIVGRAQFPTNDAAVATLDSDLPDSIKIYPVFSNLEEMGHYAPALYNSFISWQHGYPPLLMTDQQEKTILAGLRWANSGGLYHWGQSNCMDMSGWTETIVNYDSGNPIFFYLEDELILLTCHHTQSSGPYLHKEFLDPLIATSDADAGISTGYLCKTVNLSKYSNFELPDPEEGLTMVDSAAPGEQTLWHSPYGSGPVISVACDIIIPSSPSGLIWECGGSGTSTAIAFTGGFLHARCGNGSATSASSDCAYVKIPESFITGSGTLFVEFRRTPTLRVKVFWNRRLIAENTASGTTSNMTGSNEGGYYRGDSTVAVGMPTAALAGSVNASDLRMYTELSAATASYEDVVNYDHPLATWNLAGPAIDFDGSEKEKIGSPLDGKAMRQSQEFTLEGIISVNVTNKDQTIIGRWGDAWQDTSVVLWMDSGGSGPSFGCAVRDSSSGNYVLGEDPSGYTVSTGVEYHVAATYDGTTLKIYVDGIERHSGTVNFADGVYNYQFWVGDDDAPGAHDRFLNGTLRGNAMYDRALTAERIAMHASRK